MNKHGIRIAACALAGTFALSGYYTSLQAKINQSSTLPAAGIAVVLEEGTTIQELTQEVIQNIAYLESASGIQPNIIIASEKVAMAETPMQEETTVDSDVVQALVDSVSGDNTDNGETKSITDSLSAGFSATDTYEDTEDTTEESSEESSEESQTETVEEETSEDTEEETTEEATEEETTEVATEEEQDFRGLVIAQVNNYVNVRSIPSEDGEIVGKLYDKSVGEFEEEVNGWYKITSGNCTGYVKAEYCVTGDEAQALAKQVGTTYAVVNTTTLKVRQEASTESAVLGLVPIEEELVVVEELDGWVKAVSYTHLEEYDIYRGIDAEGLAAVKPIFDQGVSREALFPTGGFNLDYYDVVPKLGKLCKGLVENGVMEADETTTDYDRWKAEGAKKFADGVDPADSNAPNNFRDYYLSLIHISYSKSL